MATRWAFWALGLSTLTACGSPSGQGESVGATAQAVSAPLAAAFCDANVIGLGSRAVEDDYLPHVIQCENGGADLEALKAQAIAARSVLYYNMATQGSICDGQGCQVYSCGAQPEPKHYQAVKETAGMYLSYAGMLTYGFFVAGDSNTGGAYCVGQSGSTEKYVTYNWGKTGAGVTQTSLGYIGPPGFGQNRGCLGQWGSRCLESHGFGYMDILRFYYGSDIDVAKATGPCTGGCDPTGCNGTKIVSACGEGDCAAYGATCVDDNLGVRCSSVFCPTQGQAKVCVNDKLIGDCNDGAISTGDCSAYGAACVDDAKGARCVVVFCADNPATAHDVCLPNGQLGHCSDVGALDAEDCPASDPCTQDSTGARCGASAPNGAGAGGTAGTAASGGKSGSGGTKSAHGSGGTGGSHAGVDVPKGGVVPADDSGCSLAPGRGSPRSPVGFGLLALALVALRRRSRPRLTALALGALFASPLAGCAVAPAAGEHDPDDQCEAPAVQTTSEALSSVDCNQHSDTGYTQGNPFPINLVTIDGKPVEMATANAYFVMAQAAAGAGITLQVVSGFRTMAEQQYLYSCYVNCNCNSCNLAAKPGYSNHQSGHALDLNTSAPGVYDWLAANAGAFGFQRTVPSEAWHWEWWGGGPGGGPCGTCTPHCEGSKIIGQDCGSGDCAAYGATCVDDNLGVRCASVFCPAQGQKKVCVNDKLIGDCNDGAISTGDCSAYGAACVDDAKGARCVVVFCADQPATAHDVCIPNGQLGHCDDVGGLSVEDCPASKPCTADAGGAQCGAKPAAGSGGGAGAGGASASGGAASAGSGGTTLTKISPTGGAANAGAGGRSANDAAASNEPMQGQCACRAGSTGKGSGFSFGLAVALALALARRRGSRAESRTGRSVPPPPRARFAQ